MKIVITGRSGQVARALQRELSNRHHVIVLGQTELDLSHTSQIDAHIRPLAPDLIINAAAYTAVDQAEEEPERAYLLNANAPGRLAMIAQDLDIPLIHYSTDYVFDGTTPAPYTEAAIPHPLGVYGKSKLAGEEAIREVGGRHLILRTSWVYSHDGHCFLNTMRKLLQERDELNVVCDQIGAPTWATTIASVTTELIEHYAQDRAGPWGLYHLTAKGHTSWYGFAEAIAKRLAEHDSLRARLNSIKSESFPTPAVRPLNSRLDCHRLERCWNVTLPNWETAFAECWQQLEIANTATIASSVSA